LLGASPSQDRPRQTSHRWPRRAAKRQQKSRRTWLATAVAAAAAPPDHGAEVVGATAFSRSPATCAGGSRCRRCSRPPRGGLTAELAVTEKKWGTELNWACQYTKDWSRNVGSYEHRGDHPRRAFRVRWAHGKPAGDEATGLSAATSIPTSQIRTVDIRVTGSNEPLAIKTLRVALRIVSSRKPARS